MIYSKWAIIAILVVESLLFTVFIVPLADAAVPYYCRGRHSPTYIELPDTWQVDGSACSNTVQNVACHAYCTNKHANSIYVYDDMRYLSDVWAEVGWMWAKHWNDGIHDDRFPLWYADRLNSNGVEEFHLFSEQIKPGTNHTLKLQWVTSSSNGQWRFYRDDGEICRLNGLTLRWGWSVVSGEKWDPFETNTSNFWNCRHKGAPGYGMRDTWYDWDINSAWKDNDQRYKYYRDTDKSGHVASG